MCNWCDSNRFGKATNNPVHRYYCSLELQDYFSLSTNSVHYIRVFLATTLWLIECGPRFSGEETIQLFVSCDLFLVGWQFCRRERTVSVIVWSTKTPSPSSIQNEYWLDQLVFEVQSIWQLLSMFRRRLYRVLIPLFCIVLRWPYAVRRTLKSKNELPNLCYVESVKGHFLSIKRRRIKEELNPKKREVF